MTAIDARIMPTESRRAEQPDLTGRIAICSYHGGVLTEKGRYAPCAQQHKQTCDCTAPSSPTLGFFGYRGPGSDYAATTCKACGYHKCVHPDEHGNVPAHIHRRGIVCREFTPIGDAQDVFYCGCFGLD